MSTVVIQLNDDYLSDLKKFIRSIKAKMRVIKDEEDVMAKLMDEGLASETIPTELFKKELDRHASGH